MAFSALPSIFGRFAVGWMSGYLLNSMCDGSSPYEEGKCNGLLLWLSAFAAVITRPIFLFFTPPFSKLHNFESCFLILAPFRPQAASIPLALLLLKPIIISPDDTVNDNAIDDDRLIPLSYREGIDDGLLPSDPSEWVEEDSVRPHLIKILAWLGTALLGVTPQLTLRLPTG